MRMDFVAFEELLSRVEVRIIKKAILHSYSVPFKIGGVANLSSCHVIGCSQKHRPVYRREWTLFIPAGIPAGILQLPAGITASGACSVWHQQFLPPVNRPVYWTPVYRPIYRLVGPCIRPTSRLRFCRSSARLHHATKSQTLRLSSYCTLRLCRINKRGFCITFSISRSSFTKTVPK